MGFDGPASAMLRLWYWIVKVERLDLGSGKILASFRRATASARVKQGTE